MFLTMRFEKVQRSQGLEGSVTPSPGLAEVQVMPRRRWSGNRRHVLLQSTIAAGPSLQPPDLLRVSAREGG